MQGPFSVDPGTIASLSPYDAAAFAARLIRADAAASGLPPGILDIPMNIAAPGGGVDGTAAGSPRESGNGLVKKGLTAYQFRTGRFAPGRSIPDMLFTGGGEIKPRIKSCLDAGGTLVVLLFGWDGTAVTDGQSMPSRFRRALAAKSEAYADAKVDVLGLNKIAATAGQFPALALGLRDRGWNGAMSHRVWSSLADMQPTFQCGPSEESVTRQIQACLLGGRSTAPIHVVVSGEPGSGKTRIVLEATRTEGLASRVVYTENPASATAAIDSLGLEKGCPGTVLVVDECGPMDEARIWNRLKGGGAGIDLVTIYNEAGIETDDTRQIAVEDMGDDQIASIISGYAKEGGGGGRIDKWVEYCSPSPRAAHIVGKNLADNPRDMLKPPSNVRVWERWVAGHDEAGGEEYRDRLTVLRWLALFTRFGFDPPHDGDAEQIARMVQGRHPGMELGRFKEIVRSLRSTKVLQGHSILYITPRILHDYMWLKWWEYYGPGDAPQEPTGGGGGGGRGEGGVGKAGHERLAPLYSRYCNMLASMQGKKGAVKVAERLFGRDGPFGERAGPPSAIGSRLFGAASRAGPAAALAYMERGLAAAEQGGDATDWQEHCIEAVQVLRPMLRKRETFAGAAGLLLSLSGAVRGGGKWAGWAADEARRAFVGAFDPAPQAGFAATPLAERLEVLAGAVRGGAGDDGGGGVQRRRQTALLACGAVLRMNRFSLAVPHYSGFGRVASPWRPGNRAEVCSYLGGVLGLLDGAAAGGGGGGDPAAREAAARAVLGGLAQAALVPEIACAALDAAERMRSAGLLRSEELVAAAERLVAHEDHRMDAAALSRARAIADGAARAGIHERLARLVGREASRIRGRIGPGDDEERIARLAGELAGSPAALGAELEWLAGGGGGGAEGGEAVDGRAAAMLGAELAARDAGGRLLAGIEDATRRSAGGGGWEAGGWGYLLCGYLAGMRRGGPGRFEDALDRMASDRALLGLLPTATCMEGGVSDRSARRLLRAAGDGLPGGAGALACLGYGRRLDGAGEDVFWDVVHALLDGEAGGEAWGSAALNMICTRYALGGGRGGGAEGRRDGREAGPPPGEALDALLHGAVLGGRAGEEGAEGRISIKKWAGAAMAIAAAGERGGGSEGAPAAVRLAGAVIRRIGRPGIFESDAAIAAVLPALGELLRMRPREVWEIAAACIAPSRDKRSCRLRSWLAGDPLSLDIPRMGGGGGDGGGAIAAVPVPVLIDWAAAEPESRPGLVADLLPPSLDVARMFLARFGDREGVADGLARAFGRGAGDTEGAGRRLALLEDARRGEADPRVAAWLDGRIGEIRGRVRGPGGGGGGGARRQVLVQG